MVLSFIFMLIGFHISCVCSIRPRIAEIVRGIVYLNDSSIVDMIVEVRNPHLWYLGDSVMYNTVVLYVVA